MIDLRSSKHRKVASRKTSSFSKVEVPKNQKGFLGPGFPGSFNQKCYELLKKVPKGKVTTYKSIANELNTKAYRAVGTAMNKNPFAPKTPCHRVINSNGSLGGYVTDIKNKIKLLKSEGVEIKNNKVDLKMYGYFFN